MEKRSDRVNPFVNRQPLTRGGREAFLARVRKGLNHPADASPAPASPPPPRDESLIRQVKSDDPGRVERWIQKARGNTMVVHPVPADPEAVVGAIDSCFSGHIVSRLILNAGEFEPRFSLSRHFTAKGIGVLRWGEPGCAESAFSCNAAVTDCHAGLADTGAVLVWSDAGFGRSSTLVVPVHVVLLPESKIIADMIDGFDLLVKKTAGVLPSNVIIINGPSKTADIEMNLVTGVHGPKYVHVVLIQGI